MCGRKAAAMVGDTALCAGHTLQALEAMGVAAA